MTVADETVSIPPLEERPATTVVIETTAPKRRRRWPIVLAIVVVGILALGVGAFFVAEPLVRDYAQNYAKQQIVQVLALPEDTAVDVTLGEGSIILQALSGAIGEVNVDAPGISFGPLTGDARIEATKVPLDGSKPVGTLDIRMSIPESGVRAIAGSLSGLDLESIELRDGVIAIGSEFNIFGFILIPVGADLAPGAVDGAITFDPVTIYVGHEPITVADLRNNPQFSALAGQLLNTQTVCVASSLPQALTVTDVRVIGDELVVRVNGDGTPLSGPGLSAMGTCE